MVQLPTEDANDPLTGELFQQKVSLNRESTATFLRELADQLEDSTDLTMMGDDWEIPLTYQEPIEIEYEIEPAGTEHDQPFELELEIEFAGSQDGGEGLTIR